MYVSSSPTRALPVRSLSAAVILALIVLSSGWAAPSAHAQSPTASTSQPTPKVAPNASTGSSWAALTPAQRTALAPLASAWNGISEGQKRKWIAMSQNYPGLSPAEQSTLHGRMTEWAALSAAQRNQARLNFAKTKDLSTEEKKTQWEAYKALSPEQQKQLASKAQPKPIGAAPALTLAAPNRLAAVPITRSEPHVPALAASKPQVGHVVPPSPSLAGTVPVASPQ